MKNTLGQFYTTNYSYILNGLDMYICDSYTIIEPFAGNGDLLRIIKNSSQKIEAYDIDPKQDYIIKQDTIKYPPDYNEKFIITNPPYLARNKTSDKSVFDMYKCNDLYKCFISQIISTTAIGGILIIPINFFSSMRKSDRRLRKQFLEKFDIIRLNIFEHQVFDDTKSSVCSFCFKRKDSDTSLFYKIPIFFYPSGDKIDIELNEENNFTVGGEIYNVGKTSIYSVSRWTRNTVANTHLVAKCIDKNDSLNSNSIGNMSPYISLTYVSDNELYCDKTDNLSIRSYLSLIIFPELSTDVQKLLAKKFNEYLNTMRKKYRSLFLPSFRENTRKRISFKLLYSIVKHVLNEIMM